MRKTKIICTIGPACESEEQLRALCLAGMNVARLNFSHGNHAEHLARIERLRRVREELKLPLAIMLDTRGPEYRIKTFRGGSVTLREGDIFTFHTDEVEGDETQVSVTYANLAQELEPGDTVLVNNGLLAFRVEESGGTAVTCRVTAGGVLSDRKSMSFPGKVLKQPYLGEQDRADIRFGVEQGVDFIACSFVSCREDLKAVHELLESCGGGDIELIAKIENRAGIRNIREICEECSGIMIGRGDLGVEIPLEELPAVQKQLIQECRMLGKRVITATEMLESMIHNPRPTRAEASDVANAVYDGTSAVMLSGETAAGKYPVLAVETMARIARCTEENIRYERRFRGAEFRIKSTVDAISHATCGMAIDVQAKAIAVCSLSGITARMVSRFRPPVDIVCVTTSESTWRRLAMSWGVTPVLVEQYDSTDVLFYHAKKAARAALQLQPGDRIIITGGNTNGVSGNTNMIKVESI